MGSRRKKLQYIIQVTIILCLVSFGFGTYLLPGEEARILITLGIILFIVLQFLLYRSSKFGVIRNRLLKIQRRELALRVNELTVLHEVSGLDSSSSDLDSFLPSLLELACNVFRAPAGEILLLEGDELKYRAWRGLSDNYVEKVHFRVGEGLIGRSAQGEIIRVDDLHKHPQALFTEENLREGFSSFLSVPLHVKGKIIGVMAIRAQEVRTFSDADARLLATMANHAASFIDKLRLYHLLKESNRKLELINKVARVINSSLDSERIFKHLLEEIVNATGLRRCTLFNVDYETRTINAEVSTFLPADTLAQMSLGLDNSLTGKAVENGKTLIISDMKSQKLSSQYLEQVKHFDITTVAVVPISYRGRVNGVIHLDDRGDHQFREWEIDLVEAAADHAGMALENARLYQKMSDLAVMDGLTGAYTRQYMNTRFEEEWSRCQRHDVPLALLMVDIDDFKAVNDEYGHVTGDRVLKQVVKIITGNVRKSDVVSRYGGEEFLIILPDTDRKGALKVAKKIRREVEHQTYPRVTVSVGIAQNNSDYQSSEQFLQEADTAMYSAKKGGKNRVFLANKDTLEVIESNGH